MNSRSACISNLGSAMSWLLSSSIVEIDKTLPEKFGSLDASALVIAMLKLSWILVQRSVG